MLVTARLKYVADSEWGFRRYLDASLLKELPYRQLAKSAQNYCRYLIGRNESYVIQKINGARGIGFGTEKCRHPQIATVLWLHHGKSMGSRSAFMRAHQRR